MRILSLRKFYEFSILFLLAGRFQNKLTILQLEGVVTNDFSE